MNNMMIRPSLVGLRIGLGTGRTSRAGVLLVSAPEGSAAAWGGLGKGGTLI